LFLSFLLHSPSLHTHTHTKTQSRSEEHTSELQSHLNLVCRLLLEKKECDRFFVFCVVGEVAVCALLCAPRVECALRAWCGATVVMLRSVFARVCLFFFNDTATTEIYTLSLHDALPI